MKIFKNLSIRLRWAKRRLKNRFRQHKERRKPLQTQASRKTTALKQLPNLLILILRVVPLIRELFRLILRSFQDSEKN